jgi:hypothetical protein
MTHLRVETYHTARGVLCLVLFLTTNHIVAGMNYLYRRDGLFNFPPVKKKWKLKDRAIAFERHAVRLTSV